jgi:hypothetical protein
VGNGSGTEPSPRGFQFGAVGGWNLTRTVLSLPVGWSVGGKWRGGVVSGRVRAVAGLASEPPAEDDIEVHEATAAAPSSGAWFME